MNDFLRPITLDDCIKKELPVYVLNRSKPKGNVTIVVIKPDNSTALIVIPKTFIPVCVTDQVNRSTLAISDDFRMNIAKGMIQLVHPEEAEKFLKNEDSQSELKRLSFSKFADQPLSNFSELTVEAAIDAVSGQLGIEESIRPVVLDIMSRDISDEEKYLTLRSEDTLEPNDYRFIIAKTESPKLKEWAEKGLAATRK